MNKVLYVFIIGLLVLSSLVGCSNTPSKWNDGEYEGAAEGMHGDVTMKVVIKDGKITTVDVVSQTETEGISDLAFEKIPASIVEKQGIEEVDTVAGATVSSTAIINAVDNALKKAVK